VVSPAITGTGDLPIFEVTGCQENRTVASPNLMSLVQREAESDARVGEVLTEALRR